MSLLVNLLSMLLICFSTKGFFTELSNASFSAMCLSSVVLSKSRRKFVNPVLKITDNPSELNVSSSILL